MSTGDAATTTERFCTRSREFGVTVTRVPTAEGTAALADICEPPVIATELPWTAVDPPSDAVKNPSPNQLKRATTGVTPAVGGVADYGSVLIRATSGGDEPVSLFPERHVAVLHESDIVSSMATAVSAMGNEFRTEAASIVIATGPSATADMGDLVVGAHGPQEVHVLLLEDDGEPSVNIHENTGERDKTGDTDHGGRP